MRLFKKKTIALLLSSMVVPTAYATLSSNQTEAVVGFLPYYANTAGTNAITGTLTVGSTLTVVHDNLQFTDPDGDLFASATYEWKVGGVVVPGATTGSLTLLPSHVGKSVSVAITPTTATGDPDVGKTLTLDDMSAAGAGGGDGSGNVGINETQTPIVTNLQMFGTLAQGQTLWATYSFDANGGNQVDASDYGWGYVGEAPAVADSGVLNIITTGEVPSYTIEAADAGEVIEVAVRAQNGLGLVGNTLSVDSNGEVTDTGNGNTGGAGSGSGGVTGGDVGGTVPYIARDPASVTISFTSTATVVDNGIDGQRPVAGVDEITANIIPAAGGFPVAPGKYTYQWKADGENIGAPVPDSNTFTPQSEHQTKQISVDVVAVP